MKTMEDIIKLSMRDDRGDRVIAMSIPQRKKACGLLSIKLAPGERFSCEPVTRRILNKINEVRARIIS